MASTPYEDLLAQQEQEKQDAQTRQLLAPSYMTSADTLNIANNNTTFAEDVGNLAVGFAEGVGNIPSFVAASLISGANQLYNVPMEIGNLFGSDYEISKTEDVIASIDSDLSKFYDENKEGADLVGFIASSLVPGLGGIKILNAGQTSLRAAMTANKFGTGTGKALGLLVPDKGRWIAKAVEEAATGTALPTLMNKNALRGMAAGFGQNMLEATAFEVAVAATMFNSPVLEDQDFGDLAANVMWGGLVFGAVGGAVDATKSFFKVSKAAKQADLESMPWTRIEGYNEAIPSSERIAMNFEQLDNIPAIPAGLPAERVDFLKAAARKKAETIELDIRSQIGKLAKGDEEVAQVLYEVTKAQTKLKRQGVFIGAEEVTRVAEKGVLEKELEGLSKKLLLGKASAEEAERATNLSVAYTKAWGEGAGRVSSELGKVTALSDTLKKGQKIELAKGGNKITAGDKSWKFDTDAKKDSFNMLKADGELVQARHIWAQTSPALKVPTKAKPLVLGESDIPLLEKAYRELDGEELAHFGVRQLDGEVKRFTGKPDMLAHINDTKLGLALRIHNSDSAAYKQALRADPKAAAKQLTQDEIAAMVNVRPAMLSGELRVAGTELDDIFALQSYSKEYSDLLRKQGSLKLDAEDLPIWNIPQHTKVVYDSTSLGALTDNNVVSNMVMIKQHQKLYQEGVDRAVSSFLEGDAARLVELTGADIRDSANRIGATPGLFTAASGNYGSLASKTQQLGNTVTGIVERAHAKAKEALEPALYKLGQNQEAAIEYATLNNTLRSIPENYVLNEAGDKFILAAVSDWQKVAAKVRAGNAALEEAAKAAGKKPPRLKRVPDKPVVKTTDAPEEIAIRTESAREVAKLHIELNARRVEGLRGVRTAQGVQDTKRADAFYPTPVDPKDSPFFALVSDDSITGTGHTKTLYANTDRELQSMITKLEDNPHLTVRTKLEAEGYYKSIGQWDIEKTLNENYLDASVHRKGISASYTVPTDPQKVVDDLLGWHMQRETGAVRETVLAKYEVPFAELRRLGDAYTNIATSKFSNLSALKYADDVVENPYGGFIKTALGLKNYADYPWWVATNRMADDAISKMYTKMAKAVETAKTPQELAATNKILEQSGYKGAAYDESMDLFANARASKGILTAAIQKANGILATVALRLDFLNSANNAISANVLLGSEARAVLKAIEAGDTNAVGRLAEVAKISVPGTGRQILSPSKLIANSMKRFGSDTAEMQFYRDNRFITSISDQYRWTLDAMTYNGKESVQAWSSRIDGVHSKLTAAVEKGERWTGNKLAEEFNRFVAADVMKQITDIAVTSKIMTAKEQLAYINTFVNRTQGNYLAAQRPMMFQGPIGQAVGLFQTYQFNLMQQLLRHVGEGGKRDAMSLLALQGTIHGMNGLPAFNAVNQHIVGNASGNQEHRDLYAATYGTVGKQAGDWLLYGMASNMLLLPDLKVNLYTRGDINPRYITVLPTSPADVPIVGAATKFFSNLFETAGKLAAGGDVGTVLLQGIEHNGVSRPLAGLGQTLEGLANPLGQTYSTSNKGNVIASNDLLSLANLGRLAGGKPMDEAIAIDATFRLNAYTLRDNKKRQALGESIKSTLIAGKEPSTEQMDSFAQGYAETGGKQEQFNQWMVQLYKTANTSQANKIQEGLGSRFSQDMQEIMGGYRLKDFAPEGE